MPQHTLILEEKENYVQKSFFPGTAREYVRYGFHRRTYERLRIVVDLLIGLAQTDEELDKILENYFADLDPQKAKIPELYSRLVLEQLKFPTPTHISLYPTAGEVTSIDKNALVAYELEKENSPDKKIRTFAAKIGSRFAFDTVIRQSSMGFDYTAHIQQRLQRRFLRAVYDLENPLATDGLVTTLRKHQARLVNQIHQAHKKYNLEQLATYDNQRKTKATTTSSGSTLNNMDAVWESLYLRSLGEYWNSEPDKLRREGLHALGVLTGCPPLVEYYYPKWTVSDADAVQAFNKGLVDELPFPEWLSYFFPPLARKEFGTGEALQVINFTMPRAHIRLIPTPPMVTSLPLSKRIVALERELTALLPVVSSSDDSVAKKAAADVIAKRKEIDQELRTLIGQEQHYKRGEVSEVQLDSLSDDTNWKNHIQTAMDCRYYVHAAGIIPRGITHDADANSGMVVPTQTKDKKEPRPYEAARLDMVGSEDLTETIVHVPKLIDPGKAEIISRMYTALADNRVGLMTLEIDSVGLGTMQGRTQRLPAISIPDGPSRGTAIPIVNTHFNYECAEGVLKGSTPVKIGETVIGDSLVNNRKHVFLKHTSSNGIREVGLTQIFPQ